MQVARDPFARGEYERRAHAGGTCAWCGAAPRRTYSYVWASDDGHKSINLTPRVFCGLGCFRDYYR